MINLQEDKNVDLYLDGVGGESSEVNYIEILNDNKDQTVCVRAYCLNQDRYNLKCNSNFEDVDLCISPNGKGWVKIVLSASGTYAVKSSYDETFVVKLTRVIDSGGKERSPYETLAVIKKTINIKDLTN